LSFAMEGDEHVCTLPADDIEGVNILVIDLVEHLAI
jgi:hypothetical protein